jgi:hypothetical protein
VKFNIALMLMLIAASAASAAPETKTIGPYKVSFDLNTTLNYTVKLEQPIETPANSIYQILLNTYNYTLAKVQVEEYKNLSDSSLDVGKTIFELSIANQGFNKNISAQNIIIDGKKGFVVTGMSTKNLRLWQAYYWLDSTDCECGPVSVGKTEIGIVSLYPLNVTRNLINSLHVENIKQPSKPKTLTFGPPKMN